MDVTEDSFEQDVIAVSAGAPVVVDFWAEWCGPCRTLGPVLEEAAVARGVTLAKVDVDASPALADRFHVRGIPAVKAFRGGQVVAEFVGVRSRQAVDAFLDDLLRPPVGETVDDPELAAALDGGDYEAAFELLLERISGGNGEREATRELMVRLFAELGHEHPLTVRYRRRLATALY